MINDNFDDSHPTVGTSDEIFPTATYSAEGVEASGSEEEAGGWF